MFNYSPLIVILSFSLLITSLLAVEWRDLRKATLAYFGQALLLALILAVYAYALPNHALFLWSLTVLLTKGVIIPLLLWRYVQKTTSQETEPLIGFVPSVGVGVVLMAAFYWLVHHYHTFLVPSPDLAGEPFRTNLAMASTVLVLGLYALLTRRDAIKGVIGLCLLENGVHMSLVSLAPTIPETAMIGVVTDVVISIWLLLYIIAGIYGKFGSTDTCKLSKLRG